MKTCTSGSIFRCTSVIFRSASTSTSSSSSKTTSTPKEWSQRWHGLSTYRKRRMRRISTEQVANMKQEAISKVMMTALESPYKQLEYVSKIKESSGLEYPICIHEKMITLITSQKEPFCFQTYDNDDECHHVNAADLAIETLIRLSNNNNNIKTTPEALLKVCEIILRDPIVERCNERADSILRFIQHNRKLATYQVYKSIFKLYIQSIDIKKSYLLLNYIQEQVNKKTDFNYYYNQFIYILLIKKEYDIVKLIIQSCTDNNLKLIYNLELNKDQEIHFNNILNELKLKRYKGINAFTFATLIKFCKNVDDCIHLYESFEKCFVRNNRQRFLNSLAFCSYSNLHSLSHLHLSVTDPTFNMFMAFRYLSQPEHAVALMQRLQSTYKIQFSNKIISIISETCFKSNRTDLVVQLRKLMQKSKQKQNKPTKTRKKRKKKIKKKEDKIENSSNVSLVSSS